MSQPQNKPQIKFKYTITNERLQTAINTVKQKTETRLLQRANTIATIVNEEALQHNQFKPYWTGFKINNLSQLIHNVSSILQTWNGGRYDKPITTDKECFIKTRNFWCRDKFKPIGSQLFYPIFCQLYKYIASRKFNNIPDKHKMALYIDIMDRLFERNIKFARTSAKPVILHATFFKPNRFKQFCRAFLCTFNINATNIEWGAYKVTKSVKKNGYNQATSKYIRNPNRATALHDSFVSHLSNIKLQILNCNNINIIQNAMKRFMHWINNNGHLSDIIPIKHTGLNIKTENDIQITSNNVPSNIVNNNNGLRSFQNINHFINTNNRIHNNLDRNNRFINNNNNNRNNMRESHINQLRMRGSMYRNNNDCEYMRIQVPGIQQFAPVYIQNRHTQIPVVNRDEIMKNIFTSKPTVTPTQGPQQQIQILSDIIKNNINSFNSNEIKTVTSFLYCLMNNMNTLHNQNSNC